MPEPRGVYPRNMKLLQYLKINGGVPIMAQWLMTSTSIHEDSVRSLALLSGLRITSCHKLQYRLQMQLGFIVAVAVEKASSCRSDSTPSLGASICCRYSHKKEIKKQTKNI